MTEKKMKIEIQEGGDNCYNEKFYHIYLDDKQYRMCEGYRELAMCIGSLVKSKFKEIEGGIYQ